MLIPQMIGLIMMTLFASMGTVNSNLTTQTDTNLANVRTQEEERQKQVIEEQKKLEEQQRLAEEERKRIAEETKPQTEQEYKASTKPINYGLVNKNPEARAGEAVNFKGRVFQIMPRMVDGKEGEFILMHLNNSVDTVAVVYPAPTEFTEDMTLRVWGEVRGSYDYESQAGYNLSVPLVRAGYLHP